MRSALLATHVVVGDVRKVIVRVTLVGALSCLSVALVSTFLCVVLGRLWATLALTKFGVIMPIATLCELILCVSDPEKLTTFVPVVVQPVRLVPLARLTMEVTPTT